MQESIRGITKTGREMDQAHGMRCWSKGNSSRRNLRSDFIDVKVKLMYDMNRAKYTSNPQLIDDLLSTSNLPITGGHSTNWIDRDGKRQEWEYWNGMIHARLREEFRVERGEEREEGVLERILDAFREQNAE
jgi:predicted NAD-dependent protein-ADP-ribosyltransferase YbiA (DUF1768 family)